MRSILFTGVGRRAMVLPTLLMLVMVLVFFTSTLIYSGSAGLRFAGKNQEQDQAYYAADAGLADIASIFTRGNGIDDGQFIYRGKLEESGASYEVLAIVNTALDNRGDGKGKGKGRGDAPPPAFAPVVTPDKVVVPSQTVYLRSVGTASDGATTCILGALFTLGAGSFQAGLLANQVNVQNSNFAAYDSSSILMTDAGLDPNDKSKFMRFEAILASRKKTGVQFDFDAKTQVLGSVFLAPGSPTSGGGSLVGADQIDISMGKIGNLGKAIDLPEVKVPQLAPGSSDGVVDDALPVEQITKLMDNPNLHLVVDKEHPNGILEHSCPREANNRYVWQLDSSGGLVSDQPAIQNPGKSYDPHKLTLVDGKVSFWAYGFSDAGTPSAAATLDMQPRSVENPGILEPGSYKKVTINDDQAATLRAGGTFVIEELDVAAGSTLALGSDSTATPVTIYVTSKLSIKGENAVVNHTKLPPNLKIYYTGSEPVELAGGSSAFFTLIAKDADIKLSGPDAGADAEPTPAPEQSEPTPAPEPVSGKTSFYGALIGKNVIVQNANFYYDVATGGIGEGSDANTFALLNRHRIK